MVRLASDVDGIDVVIRLDFSLAIHLARLGIDVAEAVPNHFCCPIARGHIQRAGMAGVSSTAAGRALAAAGMRG
jgi:hypothetical protein